MTGRFLAAGSVAALDLVATWLIQSTVLLAAGLLAGRLLRRRGPAIQSAWYRTTLAAVLFCPIASMAMAAMGFSGLVLHWPSTIASEPARGTIADPDRDRLRSIAERDVNPIEIDPAQMSLPPTVAEVSRLADQPEPAAGPSPPVESPSVTTTATSPTVADDPPSLLAVIGWAGSMLLAAWLLGAAVLSTRLLIGHRRMVALRSAALPAEPDAAALCSDLARRMRVSAPTVLRSPFLSSPCLDGLRRPAILLPDDAADNLRETFVHELAHLARHDGLWNLLRQAATGAMWVQPLLWLLSRRIEETAEEVCDDFVVEFGADRARYAGHLLDLAERRLPPLAPSGVGMISLRSLLARRIARILDSTRSLSTRAGRRAIAATMIAGLAGTLLTGLLGVGGGDHEVLGDEPKVEKSAVDPDPTAAAIKTPAGTKRVTVNGRVVDPEGRPIAGATVAASRYRRGGIGSFNQFSERQELDRALTERDGHFRLTFEDTDPSGSEDQELSGPWGRPGIVAWAPGFGPVWPETLAREVTEDKPLRLVRDDVPITGRVVDLEGRPVAGATIRVQMLECPKDTAAVDRWLEAAAKDATGGTPPRKSYFPAAQQLPGCEPAVSTPTTTDSDGRFRLTGLGRDRLAILDIRGPSITFRRVQVVTRRMKRLENPDAEGPTLFDHGYYGADGTIVVEPGQPIEGVVRDRDTQAPIPGALVSAANLAGSIWLIDGLVTSQTDAQGRYRLIGLPKGNGHQLKVYPPLDQPYFITGVTAPGGPGLEPVRFDISLKRGLWITGRVTDRKTGQPVPAAIHYYPFLSNTLAQAYPNFQPNSHSLHWTGSHYRTDDAGRFRVVGLPGRGIVAAKSFDRSYRLGIGADTIPERLSQQSMRREALPTYNQIHPQDFSALAGVNPAADVQEFHQDLVLQPSPAVRVHLLDPEGKPLTHAMTWGRFPHERDFGDNNLYDQSQTLVSGLDPKESRTVVFLHRVRKLGAILVLKAGEVTDDAERTVTLRPCATITGRLVDADGKPVTGGIEVQLRKEGSRQRANSEPSELSLPGQALEADGRFRIDSLAPGGSYTLRARDRLVWSIKMEPETFKAFELASNLEAEPGQVIDLGTFNAATGQRIKGPEKLAAVSNDQGKTPARDVPITGRLVDLEGRPVAGAMVQVTQVIKPKGNDLTPWIEAARRGEPPSIASNHLNYEPPITPEEKRPRATTDAQGRFRFEGLGGEKVVIVAVQGPAIAFASLHVITRRTEPIPAKGFWSPYGSAAPRVYGADFTYTALPSRPIEGIIRDAQTNQPMVGVTVESEHFAGANISGFHDVKATTDDQGHFRLVGLPKGRGNQIVAIPNDDQPYFMQEVSVPDPPGIAPVSVEIGLHRGIWIEGKVTEKETGQPVPKAWLSYMPFMDNTFAQATPEFGKNRTMMAGFDVQDRYQTRADGTYRLVGLPGRAIVGVTAHNKSYRQGAGSETIQGMDNHGHFPTYFNPVPPGKYWPTSMKEINPTEDTKTVHLDLQVDSGATVRLRVVDPQGKPVSGLKADGRAQRGRREWDAQHGAELNVINLAPGEERRVLVRNEERKLGKAVLVRAGDDKNGPVVVTLEPLATIVGRVADVDGNPVLAATIRTDPVPGGSYSLSLGHVSTGTDGKFVVPDVPVGCNYDLVVESGRTSKQRRVAFHQNAVVRPGETTDVGEIRFKGD